MMIEEKFGMSTKFKIIENWFDKLGEEIDNSVNEGDDWYKTIQYMYGKNSTRDTDIMFYTSGHIHPCNTDKRIYKLPKYITCDNILHHIIKFGQLIYIFKNPHNPLNQCMLTTRIRCVANYITGLSVVITSNNGIELCNIL